MSIIKCPKCQVEVSSLSQTCPACGSSLSGVQAAVPSSTINCPNPQCKAEVSSLTLACPACGTSLAGIRAPFIPRVAGPAEPFGTLFGGILTSPTATFERILEGPERQHVWKILFLTAFFSGLAETVKKGEVWHVLFFPLSAAISWLVLWIVAWIMTVVGKWLGGTGDTPDLYAYLVWAEIPGLATLILEMIRNLSGTGLWQLGWGALEVVAAIWAFIVTLLLLAAAHRYSAGMAFLTEILVVVLLVAVAVMIAIPFGILGALLN